MQQRTAMAFNLLLKEEERLYVAHCLELDIVATGETAEEARRDVVDLIRAQVAYAFAHDNLDHLYRPAPADVWREFYSCRGESQEEFSIEPESGVFVPPWIVATTCRVESLRYVS